MSLLLDVYELLIIEFILDLAIFSGVVHMKEELDKIRKIMDSNEKS